MAIMTEMGNTAGRFFRTFMRDAQFKDDDDRLKKVFFGGFMLGAIEGLNAKDQEHFRRELRKFQITVRQLLQEE